MANSRDQILATIAAKKFDYLLIGTNLHAAMLCYSLAADGKKVALCQSGDFDREDCFQTTTIFPESVFSVLATRKKLEILEQFRTVFPHLVLQQRVLNIGLSGFRSKLAKSIFNFFVATGQHQQSLLIDLRNYAEFKQLSDSGFRYAILSREFKVNIPRLNIEILKAAKREGAVIANYIEIDSQNEKIIFEDQLTRGKGVVVADKVFDVEATSFQLIEKNIAEKEKLKNTLRIFGKLADYQITYPSIVNCKVEALNFKTPDNVGIAKLVAEKELLQKAVKSVDDKDFSVLTKKSRNENFDVQNIVPNLKIDEMNVRKANSFPRKSASWVEEKSELHHVATIADALYDEARQTGIEKEAFLPFFYRFGSNIRDITEFAYEKCGGENAKPTQHWDLAVKRYEEISEWKIE